MKIADIEIFPVRIPVRPIVRGGIAPYVGSRDPVGTSTVTSAIYKVTTDEGLTGWGEMNLIISLGLTKTILEDYLKPVIIGESPFALGRIRRKLTSLYNPDINTLHFFSGVEMALWDLMGKITQLPVCELLGGCIRDSVPVAYAMGLMNEKDTIAKIDQIKTEGFTAVKTKGGFDVEADIRRTFLLREVAGESINLRVDMNQGYTFVQAARYIKAVESCYLQYVEQPIVINCIEEYALLRGRSATPVAINEDCYIPGNLLRAIKLNAVDVAVVDMESSGGISALSILSATAVQAGLPLAHHCAWDLGIKTAAIIHACSALEALTLEMDSTYHSHDADILDKPLVIQNGRMPVPLGSGLGIEVDEEKLRYYTCNDSTLRFVF